MGIPVAEIRERISSAEFAEWKAFLTVEPDIGTRADYLAGAMAAFVGRVEWTLGGKPPRLGGRLIQWDKRQTDSADEMAAMLESKFGVKTNNG